MPVEQQLTITPELTSKGLVLHLVGEVYLDTAPEVKDSLTRALTCGFYKRVIADLTEIVIMDSSGIAALLNSRKMLPEGVVEMYVLVKLGTQPHRILAAAGLVPRLNVIFDVDKLLDIEED